MPNRKGDPARNLSLYPGDPRRPYRLLPITDNDKAILRDIRDKKSYPLRSVMWGDKFEGNSVGIEQ